MHVDFVDINMGKPIPTSNPSSSPSPSPNPNPNPISESTPNPISESNPNPNQAVRSTSCATRAVARSSPH
eukprot:scaffold11494_cov41-Phaeocystis_antarctica.AAC.1